MVWVRFYYFHRFCSLSRQKCPNFRLLEGMTPLVQHTNGASKTTGLCTCMGQTNVNKLISVVHTCVMRMQISNAIWDLCHDFVLYCYPILSFERWNVYIMCRGKPIFVFVYVICFSLTDLCHSFRVNRKSYSFSFGKNIALWTINMLHNCSFDFYNHKTKSPNQIFAMACAKIRLNHWGKKKKRSINH